MTKERTTKNKHNFVHKELYIMLANKTISPNDMTVFILLDRFCALFGESTYVNNTSIARRTGMHRNTIIRCIKHLEELGLIKITKKDKRIVKIQYEYIENYKPEKHPIKSKSQTKKSPKISKNNKKLEESSCTDFVQSKNQNEIASCTDFVQPYLYILYRYNYKVLSPNQVWGKRDKISNKTVLEETTKQTEVIKTKTKTKPRYIFNDKDSKLANHLAKTLNDIKNINCTSNVNEWSTHFHKLNKLDKIKYSRIAKILKWYCHKLKKNDIKYIPVVFSGAAFRAKFLRLELAMNRDSGNDVFTAPKQKSEEPVEKVVLNDLQKRMCHSLKSTIKHTVKESEIPKFIQILDNWRLFKIENMKKLEDNETLQEYYAKGLFGVDTVFLEYFFWINKELREWGDRWGGSLRIFLPGGKHFEKFMKYYIRIANLSAKAERYVA